MQDCQQKRSRDNLVENIPPTPSTNVEDVKFTLRDQGTHEKCFLGLINESPALILQICDLTSGLGSVGPRFCNLLTNRLCPLWLSHDRTRSPEDF